MSSRRSVLKVAFVAATVLISGVPATASANMIVEAQTVWRFSALSYTIDQGEPLLFRNSLLLAGIGTIGTLIACILVAYGFARFHLPGKNILFVILLSTIVLPPQATIIPLYSSPSSGHWDAVIAAKKAHQTVPMMAVVNPNSGPGAEPRTSYVTGIAKLAAAGIKVVGYVWTEYEKLRASAAGFTVTANDTDGRFAFHTAIGAPMVR